MKTTHLVIAHNTYDKKVQFILPIDATHGENAVE